MIQAKVKPTYRFGNSLQAFSRIEFIKGDWRDVPAEFEAQARAHEHLEIRERPMVEAGAIETVAPAEIVMPAIEQTFTGTPTAEQILDQMLDGEEEEVKTTRRGGKRKL